MANYILTEDGIVRQVAQTAQAIQCPVTLIDTSRKNSGTIARSEDGRWELGRSFLNPAIGDEIA